MNLTDDQFWALERWIIAVGIHTSQMRGHIRPDGLEAIRETARVALTGAASQETPKVVQPIRDEHQSTITKGGDER